MIVGAATVQNDLSALSWVKKELDETLSQARKALEAYSEDASDDTQLRFCTTYLHQVYGTLQVLELYGAALLAEEMENVSQRLLDGQIGDRDDAFEVLMRAIVQLPDYLERLQAGQKDIPIVLLPLLNDLRAAQGSNLLSENSLFSPNLEAQIPQKKETNAAEDIVHTARSLRHPYQLALVSWYRDRNGNASLQKIGEILDELDSSSSLDQSHRLWWIAKGVVDALLNDGLETSASTKLLLGNVDRQIKRIIDHGEHVLQSDPPTDLFKNLLYYAANAKPVSDRIAQIKQAFNLEELLPASDEIQQARQRISGANIELFETVSAAIKEDLARVKDGLDIFVRGDENDVKGLQPLGDVLRRVSDTLGMLGLGVARNVVQEQMHIIETLVEGSVKANEASLMEMASALLYVESALDDLSNARSADEEKGNVILESLRKIKSGEHQQQGGIAQSELTETEFLGVLAAAIHEAIVDMTAAKEAIVSFIEAPYDHEKLLDVPQLLYRIQGGMNVLSIDRAANLLKNIRSYIEIDLLEKRKVPEQDELDTLADAISSVEYYLEGIQETGTSRDIRLDIAIQSIHELGYPIEDGYNIESDQSAPNLEASPAASEENINLDNEEQVLDIDLADTEIVVEAVDLPALDSAVEVSSLEDQAASAAEQAVDIESEPQSASPAALVLDKPAEDIVLPPPLSDEIDEEILEIFIEEAEEEYEVLVENFPKWKANVEDEDALVVIRRSFHTLKGSGRLVGAQLIGEFAWAFENMLNRVIDATRTPGPKMFAVMQAGIDVLPKLIAQIKGEDASVVDLETLVYNAQQLGLVATEESSVDQEEPIAYQTEEPAQTQVQEVASSTEQAQDEPESMDYALLEIFSKESSGHLNVINSFLAERESADAKVHIPSEPLTRALHTLHGSARMAGVQSIAEIAGLLERHAKDLAERERPYEAEGFDALREGATIVENILGAINLGGEDNFEYDDLKQRLVTLIDALESPVDIVEQESITEPESADEPVESTDISPSYATVELADETADQPVESVDQGADVEASNVEGEPVTEEAIASDMEFQAELGESGASGPQGASSEPQDVDGGDTNEPVDIDAGESAQLVPEQDEAQLPPELALDESAEEPSQDKQEYTEVESAAPLFTESEQADDAPQYSAEEEEEQDQELLEIFIEEGTEILDSTEMIMERWQQAPEDRAVVEELQRELHTLKGGARMAGIPAIGDLGHAMEFMFAAVAEGQRSVSDEMFSAVQDSFDRLHKMLSNVKNSEPVVPEPALVQRIQDLLHGKVAQHDHTPAATTSVEEGAVEEVAQVPEATVIDVPEAEALFEELKVEVERSGSQEMVRVRADLLDNLVNYAGEVSIYRARLGQEVGVLRFNLVELEQTVTRVKEQLRRMEMETESQILYRYEQEGGTDYDFDPLEMDQYSQMQQLSRGLSESMGDLTSIQGLLENVTGEAETLLLQQGRVNTDLQEGLMRTRMVSFSSLVPRLRRLTRQTAQEMGKNVELKVSGAESEMDRTILDRMTAPLEHMVRNSIAHGMEYPDQRKAAGKSVQGIIRLELGREGSEVVLRISDNGRGIDVDAVRQKAIDKGLLAADNKVSDHDVMEFIFQSGFSTAAEVTQIAGRGVGMDVVYSEVKQLGGTLTIDSEQGVGTRFTIRLPFTLAVSQALLVHVNEENYAVPLTSVEGVVRLSKEEITRMYAQPDPIYEYGGRQYQLNYLGRLLGMGTKLQTIADKEKVPVLLVKVGEHNAAIHVDGLMGSREIVVKSVGKQISTVQGVSGATILGDGSVILILDINALVRIGVMLAATAEPVEPEMVEAEEVNVPSIMVVDDSITVRKVTTRLLQRHEMEAITAKDGVEALSILQDHVPDLMLLDIEMPRMDGYELATLVRNNERLKDIPIIMITSRTGDKHRNRALEIGVDRYLGKPFQETELIEEIQAILNKRRG